MASNWRLLVNELGLWGGPYDMIARVTPNVGLFEGYITRNKVFLGFSDVLLRPIGSSGLPFLFTTFAVTGNFPYGQAVLPD